MDGIVDGTAGNDLIDTSYTGDANGDRVDNGDATGYAGTSGNGDYIRAKASGREVDLAFVRIESLVCTGCGLCVQPCAPDAIQHYSPVSPIKLVKSCEVLA